MLNKFKVEKILSALRNGKLIILTDDPERENEGDLVFPAEMINQNIMNFMIRNGSGIVCLALDQAQVKKLGLKPMIAPHENHSQRHTPFTISIEAKKGVTTGVSASDRTTTILAAVHDNATADSIVSPGHIFPLESKAGGVLERNGHTEGSIDLVRLAGFKPAAVICELMNPDGTMMRGEEINAFANIHQINIISIKELIDYRLAHEDLIAEEVSSKLPLDNYGDFNLTIIKEKFNNKEHIMLFKECVDKNIPPLVRIHSSCITGDLFGSLRCDCKQQLHHSLERIAKGGGVLFYLQQEGRGIGLFNKIKAYALQEKGLDTIEANLHLNLPIDARQYYIVAHLLRKRKIMRIRLLTNNPTKLSELNNYGLTNCELEPIPTFSNTYNKNYLLTKKNKLQHLINII